MNEQQARVPLPRRPDPDFAVGRGTGQHLVVGVDGSDTSVQALTWALRYAAQHDGTVEVLTVWPVGAAVFVHEVPGHFSEARWKAVEAQAAAIAEARSLVDHAPPCATRVENAEVIDALLVAATAGDLLVLGTDRDDRWPVDQASTDGSSLTALVLHRAACPVVLVQHPGRQQGAARSTGSRRTPERATSGVPAP